MLLGKDIDFHSISPWQIKKTELGVVNGVEARMLSTGGSAPLPRGTAKILNFHVGID
jgi:hypothetical protein